MNRKLILQTKDALYSVLPITFIVLFLAFTVTPMPFHIRGGFLIGSVFLILGMGLFSLGAEAAMGPMGEHVGARLTRSRKIVLIVGICLAMGTMVTIAEPDLQVLAGQVPSVPKMLLIVSVSVGVGIFLVISFLRVFFHWKLSYLLILFYLAIFGIGAFTSETYMTVAFDAGGVTTGTITVPFILALGIGFSSVCGGRCSHDDSFGLLGLCSVGPVITVMIMGIFYDSAGTHSPPAAEVKNAENFTEVFRLFKEAFPVYFMEVIISLLPIVLFFVIFQLIFLKLPKSQMIKITVGIIYTLVGLVLFLTGVNVGFLPAGSFIGEYLGGTDYNWILIPISMAVGFFIVAAEPAVHVLNKQVEEITGGAISKNTMLWSLSIGVAVSAGLSIVRALYGVSIWYFLFPGYLLALALTFFVPGIFVAVAFDSGGVASGTMTATFLLPFAAGACMAAGGNVLKDAFGMIAMVAMAPLVTIQVMGFIYKIKVKNTELEEENIMVELSGDEELVSYDYLDFDELERLAIFGGFDEPQGMIDPAFTQNTNGKEEAFHE